MRKDFLIFAASIATASLALFAERDARACGGCLGPPPSPTENPTVVTDHRMILTISQQQTTLYDQIRYSGAPSSFAWVLPIASAGNVNVGLSADVAFDTVDKLTQTVITAPPLNCPPPPVCNRGGGQNSSAPGFGGGGGAGGGGGDVSVTKQQVVGPYQTVQLHATDPNALNKWLAQNGYVIPQDVVPVVDAYVNEHFDFLAMKLVPDASVTAMRPVRVTTQGALPVLPLRMVSAGTGATVGITLWVLADGGYEPQNFPFFHINDADLVWDWTSQSSNYKDLRAQNEANLNGSGWELESSTDQSQALLQNGIMSGGYIYGSGYYGGVAPADQDYEAIPASGSNPAETADQVRQDDLRTLFAGLAPTFRVTRLRSDLAHAALSTDLVVQASQDQTPLSNQRQVTHEANEPLCPVYDGNCNQVGTAPRSQVANANRETFSCSTASDGAAGPITLAGIAGFFGVAFARARRRRK